MEAIQRIDKWLWCARFVKTRTKAAALVQKGRIRRGGKRICKPGQKIKSGDVLTFPLQNHVRVIKIISVAKCRGPYAEATRLYEDLAPPQRQEAGSPGKTRICAPAKRDPGSGRPTKRERRKTQALKNNF